MKITRTKILSALLAAVASIALFVPIGGAQPYYQQISASIVSAATQFRAAAGSAAVPSYSFTADPDTGLRNTSANVVGVVVGGVERFVFSSSGFGLKGSTSGTLTLAVPAVAGTNTLTFPAGTTDFSATGGTSQVVKQTSAGGALTVARLACADLSDSSAGCTSSGTSSGTNTGDNKLATTQVSNSASYFFPIVASSTNSTQTVNLGTGLSFNPSTNTLATTTFSGALSGNASTASAVAVSGITGAGTGVLTAAAIAVNTAGGFATSAVTSLPSLVGVGTITSGVWNAGAVTSSSTVNATTQFVAGTVTAGVPAFTFSQSGATSSGLTWLTANGPVLVASGTTSVGWWTNYLTLVSGGVFGITSSATNPHATCDGGFSRLGAASWGFGNCTASSTAGSLSLTNLTASGNLATGTGTSTTAGLKTVNGGAGSGYGSLYAENISAAAGNFAFAAYYDGSLTFLNAATGGSVRQSINASTITTVNSTGLTVTGALNVSNLTTATGTPNAICQNSATKEITVNAALTCTVSSRDYKTGVKALAVNGLALVSAMQPDTFFYKDRLDRNRIGFMAEDLAAIDPRLAEWTKEGKANSIDFAAMMGVFAKAIQEQQTQIIALKAANDHRYNMRASR